MKQLAIVGPTATGKTELALQLADRVDGVEAISVDSMQVYRGMDIGTAKPTPHERTLVPHHMIDVLDPSEESSVSWFQRQALASADDIAERGGVAVFVGGTGLYHRAVIDRLDIPGQWPEVLAELESEEDTAALHDRLTELDPDAAERIEPTNRRRTLRALEVTLGAGRPFSSFGPGLDTYPVSGVIQVGLALERDVLASRIESRLADQMSRGFLDEVRRLDEAGPLSRTAAQALGYRELLQHVRDGIPLDECVEMIQSRTRRFAIRQERWFRRDPRIRWFDAEADDLAEMVVEHWTAE